MGKKSETALEKKQRKKKELAEDEYFLEQVDKHGREIVIQEEKEKERQRREKTDRINNDLESLKNRPVSYRKELAEYGQKGLEELDFPDGWEYYAIPTDGKSIRIYGRGFQSQVGVLFVVRSPKSNVYIRGIRISNRPEKDSNAIRVLVVQTENVIDSEKGILLSDRDEAMGMKKTEGGLLIP